MPWLWATLEETFEQVESATGDDAAIGVAGSNAVLASIDELGLRSYIAEPDRGRRRWKGKPQAIVYANRRRMTKRCSAS